MKLTLSLIALLLFLLSAACGSTSLPTATAEPAPVSLLPHAVYYLEGLNESSQVWRLETDGRTRTQLTHEDPGVEAYSVSPTDGSLAVVSGNRLYLLDETGNSRQLIADGNLVDVNTGDYAFRSSVSDPVFSPDGRTLAYAFDGLHLYDVSPGQDRHPLTNLGNLLGEIFVFDKEVYSPGPWSPDGSRLLILMGYYEGTTLAVMEPSAAQPYRRLRTDGPTCCLYSWSADGRSVWVANPYFNDREPGLWRFDPGSGEGIAVIPGVSEDGMMNYVGWPLELPSGELLAFQATIQRFSPDEGIPLTLLLLDTDGSNPRPLRPEKLRMGDVLWAADGSYALVLHFPGNGVRQIILLPRDGSALQTLIAGQSLRSLSWGP